MAATRSRMVARESERSPVSGASAAGAPWIAEAAVPTLPFSGSELVSSRAAAKPSLIVLSKSPTLRSYVESFP